MPPPAGPIRSSKAHCRQNGISARDGFDRAGGAIAHEENDRGAVGVKRRDHRGAGSAIAAMSHAGNFVTDGVEESCDTVSAPGARC